MLRLLADENFTNDVVWGLMREPSVVDVVRVQDVGLMEASDPQVLAWAAENDRILLTHDKSTLPDFAYERLARGEKMPGVFVFSDRYPIGLAISEILLIANCSQPNEWAEMVTHLPL